jgi:hypothetical protein
MSGVRGGVWWCIGYRAGKGRGIGPGSLGGACCYPSRRAEGNVTGWSRRISSSEHGSSRRPHAARRRESRLGISDGGNARSLVWTFLPDDIEVGLDGFAGMFLLARQE